MRVVLQRVRRASVAVNGDVIAAIGRGLALLVGIGPGDTRDVARLVSDQIVGLRVFPDDEAKTNRSALDVQAEVLVVSQFTLYADLTRGRRPGFTNAAPPALAAPLVDYLGDLIQARGLRVVRGRFGAEMIVAIENDGPMTIVLARD
ncbi:MAG: D-tyrosyl-tRNA(Tyr) deacylase [Chloroflexi bacterium]|nr:D-tyrosyl-tRNA(Tyr) deacylase [Chloroflexota bacterium]